MYYAHSNGSITFTSKNQSKKRDCRLFFANHRENLMILSQISSNHSPKVRPIRQQKPLASNKPLIKALFTLCLVFTHDLISQEGCRQTPVVAAKCTSTSAKIATKSQPKLPRTNGLWSKSVVWAPQMSNWPTTEHRLRKTTSKETAQTHATHVRLR